MKWYAERAIPNHPQRANSNSLIIKITRVMIQLVILKFQKDL